MGIDLKDFYFNTPMEKYEYMIIPITMIPQNSMHEYKLNGIVHNGMVLGEIRKGMYGLPQASQLAYNKLVQNFQTGGCTPEEHTHVLLKHKTKAITFCLIVHDFGIKCVHKNGSQHLMDHLNKVHKKLLTGTEKYSAGYT